MNQDPKCDRKGAAVNALQRILADSRYTENVNYGRARKGHPEGSVRAHIAELEHNLLRVMEALPRELCDEHESALIDELRLIIHVHDTLKGQAEKRVPISNERSHASLATRFLAEFISDERLLTAVQNHDVPYSLYQQFQGEQVLNETRFAALCESIKDWKLFLLFQIIDNTTVGKIGGGEPGPVKWFLALVESRGLIHSAEPYLASREILLLSKSM